jgi:hypothetical protein
MLDTKSNAKVVFERAYKHILVYDCREQAVSFEEKKILGTEHPLYRTYLGSSMCILC